MKRTVWSAPLAIVAAAATLLVGDGLTAQQAPTAGQAPGQAAGAGRGGGRGGAGPVIFTAADADKDGAVTRTELKSTFDTWFQAWSRDAAPLSADQVAAGLASVFPAQPAGGGRGPQNQTPRPDHVAAMMAVLPVKAPATPARARKILVLAKAQGFVHASSPLSAKMVEALGDKTKAWTTVITYDPADITAANLKQYDAIFLASTTGTFLDDPNDAAATAARRQALVDFVRGGKGLAGIHAATDSYHGDAAALAGRADTPPAAAPTGGGRGGGQSAVLARQMMAAGDSNADQLLSKDEFSALADTWYDKIDPDKASRVAQADFTARFAAALPPQPQAAAAGRGGPQADEPLWPEFNKMIGGYFKFHWNDPQHISVKIDDPKSPLTAMFKGQNFDIYDETYTFAQDSFSRENVRVLTSVDYAKMSDEDKAKEPAAGARTDHDFALSWIRREGQGRVFYEAHGHNEKVYAMAPILEHMLAGIQYALGDLKADDSPSVKPGTGKSR